MALGPRDTSTLVMLTGWDATLLAKFDRENGTSFAQVVSMINGSLTALNAEINGDPLWSGLVSYTDQPETSYRVGSSNGFEEHTEYGRPDSKRADTEGHMLPLKPYDRGLGWTWDYLRKADMDQIQADVADSIKDAKDLLRQKVLTRLLKRGDDAVGTGFSPGFATAAASTSVDFTPPALSGTTFTSDHEHYVAIAGGAFTNAVFQDAKAELREHGHEPPYEAIIGTADETDVLELTDTIPAPSIANVQYGNAVTLANLSNEADMMGSYYIGVNNDIAIRVVRGIPQYYGFTWKSYGRNSQRNPLRIRLEKGVSALRYIAMPDPRSGNGAWPLQYLMLFTEFGVGVGDRTNGTARYVNNATWADGAPT